MAPQTTPLRTAALVAGVLSALLLCMLSAWFGGARYARPMPTPTPSPAEKAWHACTMYVQRMSGAPSHDAQPYREAAVKVLPGGQYTVTIYYARQAAVYQCILRSGAGGTLQLVRLEEGR